MSRSKLLGALARAVTASPREAERYAMGGAVDADDLYNPNFAGEEGMTAMDRSLEGVARMASGGRARSRPDPAELRALHQRLEEQYDLPEGYLTRVRAIESSDGTRLFNRNSRAAGPFQFIPRTATAMGLRNPYDEAASAEAAARLAADNARTLRRAGFEIDAPTLYLAHQQGGTGAVRLLSGQGPATDIVGRNAVLWNGGDANMTGPQFAGRVLDYFRGEQRPATTAPAAAPAAPPEAAAPAPAVPAVPPVQAQAAPQPAPQLQAPIPFPPPPAPPVPANLLRQQEQQRDQRVRRVMSDLEMQGGGGNQMSPIERHLQMVAAGQRRYAVPMPEQAGVATMAGGGLARALGSMGRRGDSLVAHITPREALMLKAMGGAGTTNPRTGLLEFYDGGEGGGGDPSGDSGGGDSGGGDSGWGGGDWGGNVDFGGWDGWSGLGPDQGTEVDTVTTITSPTQVVDQRADPAAIATVAPGTPMVGPDVNLPSFVAVDPEAPVDVTNRFDLSQPLEAITDARDVGRLDAAQRDAWSGTSLANTALDSIRDGLTQQPTLDAPLTDQPAGVVSGRDFGSAPYGTLGGLVGTGLGLATGVPGLGLAGSAIGTLADVRGLNADLTMMGLPSDVAFGPALQNNLSYGTAGQSAVDQFGNIIGYDAFAEAPLSAYSTTATSDGTTATASNNDRGGDGIGTIGDVGTGTTPGSTPGTTPGTADGGGTGGGGTGGAGTGGGTGGGGTGGAGTGGGTGGGGTGGGGTGGGTGGGGTGGGGTGGGTGGGGTGGGGTGGGTGGGGTGGGGTGDDPNNNRGGDGNYTPPTTTAPPPNQTINLPGFRRNFSMPDDPYTYGFRPEHQFYTTVPLASGGLARATQARGQIAGRGGEMDPAAFAARVFDEYESNARRHGFGRKRR